MGRESFEGKQTKLVAVFPCRPKVSFAGDDHILVKFNSSILRHAFLARSFGIPVFAGVPLVSDLSSFRIDSKCLWFILNGARPGKGDVEIILSDRAELVDHLGPLNNVRGPASAGDILRDIKNVAKEDTWESWLKIIREIRMRQRRHGRQSFYWLQATYKPFYLVILRSGCSGI